MASSKECPHYKCEAHITKLKFENNMSYFEAKNLPKPTASYAAAAKPSTTSVGCQMDSNVLLAAIPKSGQCPPMAINKYIPACTPNSGNT